MKTVETYIGANQFTSAVLASAGLPTALTGFDVDSYYKGKAKTSATDPIFTAHYAFNVSANKITSWDTAFGWGDHALIGYLTNQSSINSLSDVDTTTTGPTQNQVLSWNGTKWIPATSTAGTTLSGLSDTNTSNASNGKILEYDNGTWIIGEKTATGATTVIGLGDTPSNYTAKANFFVRVNPNATGLDFRDITENAPLSWDIVNSVLSFSEDTDDISEG